MREQFITLVEQGVHTNEIARRLGISSRTVGRWAEKENLNIHHGKAGKQRQHAVNEDLFDVIDTEEKAYCLGFIAADGSIMSDGRTLNITLHNQDTDILEKIRDIIGWADFKIRRGKYVSYSISSVRLVNSLTQYGIVVNKTRTIQFPKIRNDLIVHFLRGFWDGDGHISKAGCVLTNGSVSFMQGFCDYCESVYNYRPQYTKVSNRETTYRVFLPKRKLYKLMYDMYEHASIFSDRKKNAYISLYRI